MFGLELVTCVSAFLCVTEVPEYTFASASLCHTQAAILAGVARAELNGAAGETTWQATCTDLATQAQTVTTTGASIIKSMQAASLPASAAPDNVKSR